MGAKDSKPSCISYEDAIKRVTESESRRIRESFKRSAGAGGTTISKNAFIQDVLPESVPIVLDDWLYTACGGTAKGITFKDLFCGLVLLTKGTQDEKIKFLWNVYSNESNLHILKSEFQNALRIESTYQPTGGNSATNEIKSNHLSSILLSLFGQTDRVTFDQFKLWIIGHKRATVLSKWLLLEFGVNLRTELETPTFYQSLAGVTHLEENDIEDLEKLFWRLKNSAVTEQLDLELLGPLISPPVPVEALAGIFLAFDENRDGHIDFKELCCGVSAACRGPTVERSKFCFKVFDLDRDGCLNYTEIQQMISILLSISRECSNSATFKTFTHEQILSNLYEQRSNGTSSTDESQTAQQPFSISQEDFLIWSVQSSTLNIVQPFMDLLFQVCHIVLGLRPQCRHFEYEIVKGWLNREVNRGYRVGQFWYLISSDWYQQWLHYTQHNGPCSYCKLTGTQQKIVNCPGNGSLVVDEAMICDESFNSNSTESMGDLLAGQADSSSVGSGSSGISCSGTSSLSNRPSGRPGPIDNSNLLAPNIHRNIPTLTGEGGRLKRDLILSEHRDYELVPESLWKALSQWYRGPNPLPRQVIQPPNVPDIELELYPLNLRILRHQNAVPVPQSSTWGTVAGSYGSLGGTYTQTNNTNSMAASVTPKRYLAYTAAFSRLATVKSVTEFLCQRLKFRTEDVRLWLVYNTAEIPYLLEEEHLTLQELTVADNDQILLETRNKDLTWPEELSALAMSHPNFSHQERRPTLASIQSVHTAGATGLHNLGNTCFMNAALQVLFNTQPLTKYFNQDMHRYELNTANKLGTKGQLAMRYAELLKEVWTASSRSVAPLKLRFCVTKHAPQFGGGGQHDCQELLEWFLDGLHEDLNRVTDRPYSELKDSNGRADSVVAAEAWSQHHSRNQSIITDLFYGQLKSKVSCLECGHESVRFDPFSLLSLPLPVENYTYCKVLVILLDGSVPIQYGLRLNSEARYYDLKKYLSVLCGLSSAFMLVCELSDSQIRCSLLDDHKVKCSTASELFVYEIPQCNSEQTIRLSSDISTVGMNIEQGLKDIQRNPALQTTVDQHQLTTSTITSTGTSISSDEARSLARNIMPANDSINRKSSIVTSTGIVNGQPSKVSRCFGNNTMCMPQTLLCFKQATDLSTSPEGTFIRMERSYNTIANRNDLDESTTTSDLTGEKSSEQGHVVETSNDRISDCQNDVCLRGDEQQNVRRAGSYLIAVHRKLIRQDTYFLSHHKYRPNLFGVPLLIPCYDGGTNKDLYCAVWVQVARLLSPLPPTPPDQSNHATDCDDSLGYEFPFTLRAVSEGGRVCALCPWTKFCRGCEIPCNDMPLLTIPNSDGSPSTSNSGLTSTPILTARNSSSKLLDHRVSISSSTISNNNTNSTTDSISIELKSIPTHIAIDWDPTALHLRYQSTRERVWTEHESIAICHKQQTEPVDLDHCLRAFTSVEKLEEGYYCANCKGKKPATKKLQIWKLPPILIVHLKRFNFVNNKWVKSQKVVNFPFDNFDPTPYLASVPQETILRHKELLDHHPHRSMVNIDCDEEITEFDRETDGGRIVENGIDGIDEIDESNGSDIEIPKNEVNVNADRHYRQSNESLSGHIVRRTNIVFRDQSTTLEKRKRLVSTSLTKTPVIDGAFIDYHQHHLKDGEDLYDLKYKLYAVVSHSGMLNGGHYVSYASNPNNSWYCYNDSSCREINNQPYIDPGSAYLLFYERQGLNYLPYMPDVERKTLPNGTLMAQSAIDADDSDNNIRKMCFIS